MLGLKQFAHFIFIFIFTWGRRVRRIIVGFATVRPLYLPNEPHLLLFAPTTTPVCDDTPNLNETESETFFRYQIFPIPKPILFFRDQKFWNRNRDFFSNTKFSETETDTYSVNSVQAVNSVVLLPSLMAFLDALASLGSMLETQSVT